MSLPATGTILSLNDIQNEFGGTNPIGLDEYYRGGSYVNNYNPANNNIPTSGAIDINSFYGASNRRIISLGVNAPATNYCVYANASAAAGYLAGYSDVRIVVAPGVFVSATATSAYAMSVPNSFNASDTVTINNCGYILGAGGNGGTGSGTNKGPVNYGTAGGVGGNAVYVNRPTTITNNGSIYGGGGGGGGGGALPNNPPTFAAIGQGGQGGGGAGRVAGSPNGTDFAGGAGSPGGGPTSRFTPGGAGGGSGLAGTPGVPASKIPATPGGAAGKYIVGNAYVTWPAIGTRAGGVA